LQYDLPEAQATVTIPSVIVVISVYDQEDRIGHQLPRSANWLQVMKSKNCFQGLEGALDEYRTMSILLDMLPPRRSKLQIIVVLTPVLFFIEKTFDAQHCQVVLQLSNDINSGQTSVTTCNRLRFDLLCFVCVCYYLCCVCSLIQKIIIKYESRRSPC